MYIKKKNAINLFTCKGLWVAHASLYHDHLKPTTARCVDGISVEKFDV